MRTRVGTSLFLFSVLTVSIAAQSSPPPLEPRPSPDPKQADLHQAMPIEAKEFITTASDSGKAEVSLATMAEKKATNERVRQFAARLIRDHSAVNSELTGLGSKKGVAPADISPSKKAVVDRLSAAGADAFDREYMTQMVEDHKKSIDLFTRGTASGDADVKALASRTLPTIKMHLSEAEEILKGLGSSTPAPRTTPPAAGQ